MGAQCATFQLCCETKTLSSLVNVEADVDEQLKYSAPNIIAAPDYGCKCASVSLGDFTDQNACAAPVKVCMELKQKSSMSSRNAQLGKPDKSHNLFVETEAWEEGFGNVIVLKMHDKRTREEHSDLDVVDVATKSLHSAYVHVNIEILAKGTPGVICKLKFGDGQTIGTAVLTENYRLYHFTTDEESSDCRQLFLDLRGTGRMDLDKNHGLLVGGVDVLPYINGYNTYAARQGELIAPNRYTCESTIEIHLRAMSGKEQLCIFMNGTRTPLEGQVFLPQKKRRCILKYSICPLYFPIISLEVLMRFPGQIAPLKMGVHISSCKVNGNDCVKTASYYPLPTLEGEVGIKETNECIATSPMLEMGEWYMEGWYRLMCYRRLNKRHSRSGLL